MAKRTNRLAWGLVTVLAAVLLGGSGLLLAAVVLPDPGNRITVHRLRPSDWRDSRRSRHPLT
jgi:hypothetical protein